MSVLKVIELMGNSTISFEDAVQNVVNEASKTVKNIKSVHIEHFHVTINSNKISQFRVTAKLTFGILDD